jgi:hypothetical protein
MRKPRTYIGIDKDPKGAMNPTGNIIRDAWVFGIIPESETCEGWNVQAISALYDQVSDAWQPYGHLVSNLPPELRERHERIYANIVQIAKEKGWDPDKEIEDEA